MEEESKYIRWFKEIGSDDVASVGGKNASLGEMIRALKARGIRVPDGFSSTAHAYREFLAANDLRPKIKVLLREFTNGDKTLEKMGKSTRRLILNADFPVPMMEEIRSSYQSLCQLYSGEDVDVAVRSSATAEDLPEASFAGQQETFLNVTGEDELLEACLKCYSSLFTDRAITYRQEHSFDHLKVALCVGVQKMVRSDKGSSGVMFSIDTETGYPKVVVIDASWGLGENIVRGAITPDHYTVFKPLLDKDGYRPIIEKTLGTKEKKMVYAKGGGETTKNINTTKKERQVFVMSDDEILKLSTWASLIEAHYNKPMDIEWAKDGETGELFIVQARPETVQSHKKSGLLKTYKLREKSKLLVSGLAIGEAIAVGKAQILKGADEIGKFKDESILVTEMTDPDWVPIMKRAAGIITDHGGRTSHAAIVSRELGIPAIVGSGTATEILGEGEAITLSCSEGDVGNVYKGILEFGESEIDLGDIPSIRTEIMLNIASPGAAFRWWRLPCKGIGLARMEFIINNIIKIHPIALTRFDELEDKSSREQIEDITRGYEDKPRYFVEHLAYGISKIAASQHPNQVIVRMSDFKTNEYANLIGGRQFEPGEENPMLGFRGASRYYSERYRDGFALECRAIRRVREEIGLTNAIIMIPFCRTIGEADRVLEVLASNGLVRGKNGMEVYVMVEIPSNIVLADEFGERFDGFSIGSNDLTQLVLGVDRDSQELSQLFDERNDAVKSMIESLIHSAKKTNTKVGICGQAPSDYPEFAEFLVHAGIDSISLNPDSVIDIIKHIAEVEERIKSGRVRS